MRTLRTKRPVLKMSRCTYLLGRSDVAREETEISN
jgi:hypothetical protein